MNKKFFLFIGLAFVAVAAVRMYDARNGGREAAAPAPLAQGRQVYQVWSGEAGPRITEIVIDPFDPRLGDRQAMEVAVEHPTAVREVNVLMHTDRRSSPYALSLAAGSPESGRWTGSWEVIDRRDRVYHADVFAVAADATSSITLTFR